MTSLSKKQVCLPQWDYAINCNENENVNGKIDHINKIYIDLDVEKEKNIENIACIVKSMPLRNKQHLSNI